jgi:hypothetical protein
VAAGKYEIPFLIDHKTGVKLFKSADIVAYLEKEYGKLPESFIEKLASKLNFRLKDQSEKFSWATKNAREGVTKMRKDAKVGLEILGDAVQFLRYSLSSALGASPREAATKHRASRMKKAETKTEIKTEQPDDFQSEVA